MKCRSNGYMGNVERYKKISDCIKHYSYCKGKSTVHLCVIQLFTYFSIDIPCREIYQKSRNKRNGKNHQ